MTYKKNIFRMYETIQNGTILYCFNSPLLHVCFQLQPTMLAALTLASLSLLVWATNICPPTCKCFHNLTTVGCQERGLDQIPELPEATEQLYVSYNHIQEIPRRGLEKLQVRHVQQPVNCSLCVMPLKMMQHCGLLFRNCCSRKVPA